MPAQTGGMGSLGDVAAELSLQGWGLTQASWPPRNGAARPLQSFCPKVEPHQED